MKIYKVYYYVPYDGDYDISYFLNKNKAEDTSMQYSYNNGEHYNVEEIEVNEQYTSN
jgi:hypothetical protein